MAVSDDGVGLPESFDINASQTLGLHVVKILAEEQLESNLEVVRDKGTTFKVDFGTIQELQITNYEPREPSGYYGTEDMYPRESI